MNDGSFHISCTTCTTRLLVRDESAVGQILACPKCGSMVMVESPEDTQVPLVVAPDIGGEVPGADSPSTPNEPVSPPEQPTSWQPGAGHGWLPIAFGAVGALVFVGALGWYVLSGENDTTQAAVPSLPTVEETVEATPVDPVTPDVPEEEPEPEFYEDPTIVDLPETETAADIEIKADEIDPFGEADRIQSYEPKIAATETGETVTTLKPSVADELSSLANLLGGPAEFVTPPVSDDVEPSETKPRLLKTSVPTPTTAHEIKQRLELQIRAVRFNEVPLVDFLRSMTTLSGVPISLDPAALEQTAKNANVPVSVAKLNGSTMEILQAALSPIGMLPVQDDQVVRITTPRLEESKLTSASLFVGDLLDPEAQVDFANFVATLCEPKSWSNAGGLGTIAVEGDQLRVSNTRLATIRTMILLEKIRAARSLPPRNKIPSRLTSLQPRWSTLSRKLQQSIDVDRWQASTFSDVVAAIEESGELRILVDWAALARQGIEPSSAASLYARDLSLEEALKRFLKDHDLQFIPVDGETLQITSNSVKANHTFVEFYTFKQLGDDGLERVERAMLQGTAALDPASEVAIVVGNSDLHRWLSE